MIYAGCEEWTRARDSLLFMLLAANGNNSNRLHYIRLLVMIDRKSSDAGTLSRNIWIVYSIWMEMDFIPCSRARVPHFCVCERRARCRMSFEIYTINSKFTYLVKHAHAPCSFNCDVLPQNGDDACMVNEESESIDSCIFLNGSHIYKCIFKPNRTELEMHTPATVW